jgi:FKBP-type peptidyl-prolyl cis-trans isomerase FkpA
MLSIMRKFLFVPLLLLCSVPFFTGCFKDPEPYKCTYDSCSVKAPQAEIQRVQAYLDSLNLSATQHCSGLFYRIENGGIGLAPEACSGVNVKYIGALTNGDIFDSTSLGANLSLARVITGWRNGVPLLKEGGRVRLYIPPSLGYGNQPVRDNAGVLRIPANSILVFDVQLVKVY